MGKLDRQLIEDRALRDAASAVFQEDIALLRASLSPNELANRFGSKVEEGGGEVAEKASELLRDNRQSILMGLAISAGALATVTLVPNPIRAAVRKRWNARKKQEPEASA